MLLLVEILPIGLGDSHFLVLVLNLLRLLRRRHPLHIVLILPLQRLALNRRFRFRSLKALASTQGRKALVISSIGIGIGIEVVVVAVVDVAALRRSFPAPSIGSTGNCRCLWM